MVSAVAGFIGTPPLSSVPVLAVGHEVGGPSVWEVGDPWQELRWLFGCAREDPSMQFFKVPNCSLRETLAWAPGRCSLSGNVFPPVYRSHPQLTVPLTWGDLPPCFGLPRTCSVCVGGGTIAFWHCPKYSETCVQLQACPHSLCKVVWGINTDEAPEPAWTISVKTRGRS